MNLYTKPVVTISGLKKSFGTIKALDGLDMNILKGDICGFLGPNGSGKTTTIRILLSLVKPDAGQIDIFRMDSQKMRRKILPKVGALIEKPDFYEHLSGHTNLKLLLKYGGVSQTDKEILETLEIVGLEKRAYDRVNAYSDGMKQRLGIAQAIMHKPDLIILDEPFNSLDPQGVKDIRELIFHLNKDSGVTALISSHKLDELEKLANRLVLINNGKTVADGTIEELTGKNLNAVKLTVDQPQKAYTIINESALQTNQLRIEHGHIYFLVTHSLIPQVNRLLLENNILVYHLGADQSLESFFLSFMESQ